MKVKFGLWGSGWRADYFLRVARALPESFEPVGLITRNAEKAARFEKEFGVRCYEELDGLLAAEKPAFIILSVDKRVCADMALYAAGRGVPVLMETPAAPDMDALARLYQGLPKNALVQVAEQYPLKPMHAARLEFIKTRKLGEIGHVNLSYTQNYHAIALIRKYLGMGFENAEITAASFPVQVVAGPGREGDPVEEKLVEKTQTVAVLDFGGKTALFNFEADQHRSWIRSQTVQIKGERGEIFNDAAKYLLDFKTPIETRFIRRNLGENENVEGFGLMGIMCDGQWQYLNPYRDSRLVDDEIAVARCMEGMARYTQGGPAFYSLDEASQDLYLSLMVERAAREKLRLRTETQWWVK